MSECKHRRTDGVCLRDLEYVYKGFCVDGPCTEYEPKTNADRIRAMDYDALCLFLSDIADGYIAPVSEEICADCKEVSCTPCWYVWLRKEADK